MAHLIFNHMQVKRILNCILILLFVCRWNSRSYTIVDFTSSNFSYIQICWFHSFLYVTFDLQNVIEYILVMLAWSDLNFLSIFSERSKHSKYVVSTCHFPLPKVSLRFTLVIFLSLTCSTACWRHESIIVSAGVR